MHAIPTETIQTLRKPFYRQLYFQVVFAIIIGVLLGYFEPAYGEAMKPFGDAFIKLIKMIIAPVIFLTIVTGIASIRRVTVEFDQAQRLGQPAGLGEQPGAGAEQVPPPHVGLQLLHPRQRDLGDFQHAGTGAPYRTVTALNHVPVDATDRAPDWHQPDGCRWRPRLAANRRRRCPRWY